MSVISDELTSTGWPPSSAPDHAGATLPYQVARIVDPADAEFHDKQCQRSTDPYATESCLVLFPPVAAGGLPMDNPGVKLGSLEAAEG